MKRTKLLRLCLLVAACLCGESSALADPTLVYGRAVTADLPNGYTAWSSDDIGSGKWVASSGTASIDTNNRGLKVAQQRGSALATNSSQISITPGYVVTIDAVWNTGYANGGNGENNAFKIGNNIEIRAYTYDQHGDIYINGEFYANISNACIKDKNRDHDPWTIHLVINTGTNKITEFTIRGANGTNKATYTLDGTISLNVGSTYNSLSLAHNRTKGNNALEACYLTSVKITEEAQTLTTADVTFTYAKTDGTSLTTYRADEVASGVTVGTDISSLISTYGTTFYNSTLNKYVYSSYSVTGDYTTVQEGGNTVTLKYTDYPATAYTVMAQAGGSNLTSVASGIAYLDGSTTAYYSKYVKHSNQWYEKSSPYGVAISAATTNIAYTAYAANDIFDMIECENTTYTSAGDYTGTGYSNGKSVLLNGGKAMKTKSKIAAGIYDFSIYNTVRRANEDQLKLQYSTDDSNWTDVETLTFPSDDASTQTAEKVVLAEESYIRFLDVKGQNSCHLYDYILIKKYVSPTIGADGYATYSSSYALDFEHATGVKGYYTTSATSGEVDMTKITGTAAANEGLFLQKTDGDISIPVVASGSTLTGNLLKATNGSSVAASAGGTYHYVFAKQNGDLGFYNMTSALTIPAGKAYLETTAAISGARLALVFDDETTGINDASRLENSEERTVNRVVYDLQGRRVAQPAKGLYIVGGKKVIVK